MSKFLSDGEKAVLESWLEEHELENTNFRDLADGVRVAELLKKHFPHLVNLSHYTHRNSIKMKLDNWERLNKNVLWRTDLHQTRYQLRQLANGKEEAIAKFLYKVMRIVGSVKPDVIAPQQPKNDDVQIVSVKRVVGERVVFSEEKMVKYALYEDLLREYQDKEANLSASMQKIAQLQDTINMKASHCDELASELELLSIETSSLKSNKEQNKELSRFGCSNKRYYK